MASAPDDFLQRLKLSAETFQREAEKPHGAQFGRAYTKF
jgi:hypothetical protein